MISIPILVVGFNRPDLLKGVLGKLRELHATNVYVSLDGPRNPVEAQKCDSSFAVAQDFLTSFHLKIAFRNYNLGCNLGVVSALDWFFSEVDFGIVIEDDCFPEQGMFSFFQEFRNKENYYNSLRTYFVTGHNPLVKSPDDQISKYFFVGAWATWSKSWRMVRKNYFKVTTPKMRNLLFEKRSFRESVYWWVNSTRAKLGFLDTWDGIFNDHAWRLGYKTLVPAKNYFINLGFRSDATHTKNPTSTNLVVVDKEALHKNIFDQVILKYYYRIRFFHSLTPLLRLLVELVVRRKRVNLDVALRYDNENKTIITSFD